MTASTIDAIDALGAERTTLIRILALRRAGGWPEDSLCQKSNKANLRRINRRIRELEGKP